MQHPSLILLVTVFFALCGHPIIAFAYHSEHFEVLPSFRACRCCEVHDESVVVVTQLSIDRLEDLQRLAKRWEGKISAAVFIPNGSSSLKKTVRRFPLPCNVDVHLVIGSLSPKDGQNDLQFKYPVNFLRNVAVGGSLQGRSGCAPVLHLDVDLLPSFTFEELDVKLDDDNSLFVVPTFEINEKVVSESESAEVLVNALESKSKLIAAVMERRQVAPFYFRVFPSGHRPTNFTAWMETSSSQYEIQYAYLFEPYLIFCASSTPRFNERFFGRGFNKIQHVYHLNSLGYRFYVLSDYWLIHNGPNGFSPDGTILDHNRRMMAVFKDFKLELNGVQDDRNHIIHVPPVNIHSLEAEDFASLPGWMFGFFGVMIVFFAIMYYRSSRKEEEEGRKND